jgi:short-subunit dehydrogenase
MREFQNKTAVITGAGCGIGRALANQLAEKGMHLALVDVRADRLGEVAEEIERRPGRVSTHAVDVRDVEGMRRLAEDVLALHGAVHLLVNNAGVTAWGSVEEMDLEDFRWVFEINFWGVMHGCKFFLPHLKQQAEAHIVNVSSVFGIVAARHQAAYCSSKFALRGFSESLAAELDGTGVGVTVVHPGGVATHFVTDSRTDDDDARNAFADLVAQYSQTPEKVARAIVKGVERNRLRVLVGMEARPFDWAKRLFPSGAQRRIARFLAKSMP